MKLRPRAFGPRQPAGCDPGFQAASGKRIPGLAAFLAAVLVGVTAGCVPFRSLETSLPGKPTELACIDRCRDIQGSCNADARFDYRQCQAGYGESFRDYRRCLASAFERSDCVYPWWPCAENRFGYCANRAAECKDACRSPASTAQ
jgi:hypothetical protein